MGNEYWPGYDGSLSIKISNREVMGTERLGGASDNLKIRLNEQEDQSHIIISCGKEMAGDFFHLKCVPPTLLSPF